MESRYQEWIDAYVARHEGFVRGKCAEATTEMVAAFPELRRACGFVATVWGDDQHWWCVTSTGEIVDPTRAQFPAVFGYEEVDPAHPHRKIPTGTCANCGGDAFDGDTVCGKSCHDAYVAYLMGGVL